MHLNDLEVASSPHHNFIVVVFFSELTLSILLIDSFPLLRSLCTRS